MYALGVLVSRAASFAMLPVFTRALTPAEYGKIDLVDTTTNVLYCLIGVAISTALLHEYENSPDQQGRDEVVSTALLTLWGLGLVATASLWFVAPFIAGGVLRDRTLTNALRVMFATVSMFGTIEIPMMLLRVHARAGRFVVLSIFRTAVGIVLNIVFVVWLRWGVMGLVWSNFFTTLAFALPLSLPLLLKTGLRFSWPVCKAMMVYGAPAVPGSLAMLVVHNGDRYLINGLVSVSEVGTYSLGYKFGMLIAWGIGLPMSHLWTGHMWKIYKQPDGAKIFARVGTWYALVLLFAWLVLASTSREIVAIVADASYARAAVIVPIVAGGYAIREWASFHKTTLLVSGRTGPIALFEPVAAGANVMLTWVLVARYGAVGAAVATVATMLLLLGLTVVFSHATWPVRYPLRGLAMAVALAAGLYTVTCVLPSMRPAHALVLKSVIVLGYLPGVILLRVTESEDIARMRDLLGWMRNRIVGLRRSRPSVART